MIHYFDNLAYLVNNFEGMNFSNKQKTALSEKIAEGHRKFGKTIPPRPYGDDDDSGTGSAGLIMEHPLFIDTPVGAPSDLSYITYNNKNASNEAERRQLELSKTLQNRLSLSQQPTNRDTYTEKPRPY